MTLLEQMAPGALGPGLTSLGVFAVAWFLARRFERPRLLRYGVLLGVAAGFAVGFTVILRWPELPLAAGTDAWYWVAWLAPAALLLGGVELAWRAPLAVRLGLRLLAAAGAAWLLVSPKVGQSASEKGLIIAVSAVGMALLWTTLSRARQDEPPEWGALPVALAAGLSAAVLAFFSGSLAMGQVTGALSAALTAPVALAVVFRLRGESLAAPSAAVASLVFGGLLLSAYAYLNYGSEVFFPASVPLLLLAGAILGTLLPRLLAPTAHRVVGVLLATLPPLILSVIAAWIAHAHAPPPNPYG